MLARLDQDLAPLRSLVDREGSLLRVGGSDGIADVAARVADIVEQMGYFAGPAGGASPVSRWYGAADADELSGEEAEVLARGWVDELASEGVVERSDRLFEPLRAALLTIFRLAARTGSVDALHVDEASLRDVLNEEEAERVGRWIDRKLPRHHPD